MQNNDSSKEPLQSMMPQTSSLPRRNVFILLLGVGMTLLAGGLGFMLGRHAFVPNGASVQATVGYVMPPTPLFVQTTILPTPIRASPSPSVEEHPVPTATAPARTVSLFEQIVNSYYQSGIEQGDKEKLELSLTLLAEAKTFAPEDAEKWNHLWRTTAFALDALQGSLYLQDKDMGRFLLSNEQGEALVQPIDMSIIGNDLYVIDSGTLYSVTLPGITTGMEQNLVMTAILTPTATIDGFPVKEIVAVDGQNLIGGFYVLDKSNDIFFWDFIDRTWSLHRSQASELSRPDPHFLNIATYADRLYLLDTSRNQIWRYPPSELGAAYLNSDLLWLQPENGPNVTSGIGLAVDGSVFVLKRTGEIDQYAPDLINTFSLDGASGRTHFREWEQTPARPIDIFLTSDDIPLFIADSGRRRVVVLDRRDGSFIRQFIFADNPEFNRLNAIVVRNDVVYMLAGNHLYAYAMPQKDASINLQGVLPPLHVQDWSVDAVTLQDIPPNDPRVPALLAGYQLTIPNSGKVLPDQFVLYPGARRAYRYGVHQGIDFYEQDQDVRMEIGAPVLAAGDGVIIRADIDYHEMSLDEVNALLADAHARHFTPPDTLDKLGGRQVWIDHGNGLITKYEHLNGIADGVVVSAEVEKGQAIGYVGLSGTPDGIEGNFSFPHLHFEMRIGPDHQYYLGQWLTIEDTRRILEALFATELKER